MTPQYKTLPIIFEALRSIKIIPLATSISFDNLLLALDSADTYTELHGLIDDVAHIQFFDKRSLITLVGQGLKKQAGFAARLFTALKQTNCEMISHGGAENAASIVVFDDEIESAVNEIHKEFF
jgi:aspartokinase